MNNSSDELKGPLQRYEIFSQQQPNDITYSIPLDGGRQFQVTVAIVEKTGSSRFLEGYGVRRPALHEVAEGIAALASLPIAEGAARH